MNIQEIAIKMVDVQSQIIKSKYRKPSSHNPNMSIADLTYNKMIEMGAILDCNIPTNLINALLEDTMAEVILNGGDIFLLNMLRESGVEDVAIYEAIATNLESDVFGEATYREYLDVDRLKKINLYHNIGESVRYLKNSEEETDEELKIHHRGLRRVSLRWGLDNLEGFTRKEIDSNEKLIIHLQEEENRNEENLYAPHFPISFHRSPNLVALMVSRDLRYTHEMELRMERTFTNFSKDELLDCVEYTESTLEVPFSLRFIIKERYKDLNMEKIMKDNPSNIKYLRDWGDSFKGLEDSSVRFRKLITYLLIKNLQNPEGWDTEKKLMKLIEME